MRRGAMLVSVLAACALACGCGAARGLYFAATHRVVRVPTENMVPTIRPGDLAAVDEGYYSGRPVRRFDLVLFKLRPEQLPSDLPAIEEETLYVKRVIGLGGESIEVRGGEVYVDGRKLDEPFAHVPAGAEEEFGPFVVPEGEFFLLGDNRPNSMDSRYWAKPSVDRKQVAGKVVEVFPQ